MGDAVVIGAGIVGSACAYELAKAGAHVTLLEYGKAGMQATNAAAGMLAPFSEAHEPDVMFRAGGQALRAYSRIVAELQETCGFDLELRKTGILKVAFDPDGVETLQRRYAWQQQAGIALDWLDGAMCRELEPRLSERVLAGVLSPDEAIVNNQYVALALTRAAVLSGAELREGAPVTRAHHTRGRVVAIEARGDSYSCDTVVLAAGARSGQIAAKLGIDLPLFPVRGQMIALGGMQTPVRHVVWGPDGYLVPRANGLVFAGATVEDVGFRRRTTQSGIAAMRTMARRLVPQLASATVHFDWAGLRPCTPDRLPIVGPIEGTNVIAATGHFRNGILLGPLTGEWVARGLVSDDWSAMPVEFDPRRFT